MARIPQRYAVTVTTNADGAATALIGPIYGLIHQVRYVKASEGAYADGVDVSITLEQSGTDVWVENDVNASKTVAPRQATHSTAGAAALYAAGGTAVLDKIACANERVKIVVAQGGNAKSGTFHIVIE